MEVTKFLDPRNDIVFKDLFGTTKNEDIVVDFINDVMEYEGDEKIKSVHLLQTTQDPKIAARQRSNVDVLCESNNGKKIIVEMQIRSQKSYKKRAQYYLASSYATQLTKRESEKAEAYHKIYNKLIPVVFIAVVDHILFKDKEAHISWHTVLDKKTHEHDLEEFAFTFVELPKFKKKIHELDGVLDRWCYFMKHAEETREDEVANIVGQYPHIKRAYEAVNKFSWTPEQLAAYEEEEQRIIDNIDADDTLLEQGIQQGIQQGIEQGITKGKTEIVCNMHQDGMPPATIAKYVELPIQEVERILVVGQV